MPSVRLPVQAAAVDHTMQLICKPPRPAKIDSPAAARISKATGLPVRQYRRAVHADASEQDWEPSTPQQKVGRGNAAVWSPRARLCLPSMPSCDVVLAEGTV